MKETKIVYGYDKDKKYTNNLILDYTDKAPVTNKWLIPKNYTEIEVLAPKEGYDRYFEDNTWVYKEIEKEPEKEETLEEVKQKKINELKSHRDTEEVEPIEHNGNMFDYDDKSRDRLHIARQALEDTKQESILWTTADNQRVELKVEDFVSINTNAAVRSNALHVKYNTLKEQVIGAETKAEVEYIKWEDVKIDYEDTKEQKEQDEEIQEEIQIEK